MKVICWLLIVLCIGSVGCSSAPSNDTATTPKQEESWKQSEIDLINQFLTTLSKGESDGKMYCSDLDPRLRPVKLYAVRKWEIVNEPSNEGDGAGAVFSVRIESSTKEGTPIIKLYKFSMNPKVVKPACVLSIEEIK